MKRYVALRVHESIYEAEPDDPQEIAELNARPFTRIAEIDGEKGGREMRDIVSAHDFFTFAPGDAERIVACLNACEGIDTAELERKALKEIRP